MMAMLQNKPAAELLSLYGYSVDQPVASHPVFGSGIAKPLSDGWDEYLQGAMSDEEGNLVEMFQHKTAEKHFTMRNLANHFGYMYEVQDLITHLIRMSHGRISGQDFQGILGPLEARAQQKFETRVVKPAREFLSLQRENACYLYCVPSTSDETDVLTGKPIHKRGTMALTLLPVSEKSVLFHNTDDAEIALIARQVLYVVMKLCNHKMIRTDEELARALNGWPERLKDPLTMQRMTSILEEKHPYLLSSDIRALLT